MTQPNEAHTYQLTATAHAAPPPRAAKLTVRAYALTVLAHPDRADLAIVIGGERSGVHPVGLYSTGDYALCVPAGSRLPEDLAAELGLPEGRTRQDTFCVPQSLGLSEDDLRRATEDAFDFAGLLGISTPPSRGLLDPILIVPEYTSDLEKVFDLGEVVTVTEEVVGQPIAFLCAGSDFHRMFADASYIVSAWETMISADLLRASSNMRLGFDATEIILHGVLYGRHPGYSYGVEPDAPARFLLTDVLVRRTMESFLRAQLEGERERAKPIAFWLDPDEVASLSMLFRVECAPVLSTGLLDIKQLNEYAADTESVSGWEMHPRHGVRVSANRARQADTPSRRAMASVRGTITAS